LKRVVADNKVVVPNIEQKNIKDDEKSIFTRREGEEWIK